MGRQQGSVKGWGDNRAASKDGATTGQRKIDRQREAQGVYQERNRAPSSPPSRSLGFSFTDTARALKTLDEPCRCRPESGTSGFILPRFCVCETPFFFQICCNPHAPRAVPCTWQACSLTFSIWLAPRRSRCSFFSFVMLREACEWEELSARSPNNNGPNCPYLSLNS